MLHLVVSLNEYLNTAASTAVNETVKNMKVQLEPRYFKKMMTVSLHYEALPSVIQNRRYLILEEFTL
jgi:hypothetical protein